ncbi:hypothetical protein MtrunA17_Chr7g0239891 [Medicago truncatula]|uniref:DUF674 family protein n=1 Tax=Medicago truncatula TaxID=3880 RepID=A0A396H4Z6_MEDTR|nr:hypothetical protein MtrunA17_Chr7g0239891 [Medicago truncatula]
MAATTTQTKEQVSLKLLVNKETNKVLFAEAGKDFVDVLFSFLTLPLGTIARLVEKESSVGPVTLGCLNSLYHCVEDLDEGCLGTKINKEMLLQPANSSEDYCSSLKLNIDDTEPTKYFLCTKFPSCVDRCLSISLDKFKCRCKNPLNRSVMMKHFRNGFVNSGATFIIKDDLTVMPNSMDVTNFSLLQNFGIKSASSVKEMNVSVLDLLKCSLFSKTPLTDLFLRGNKDQKPSLERPRFVFKLYFLQVLNLLKCSLFSKTLLTDLFLRGNKDRKPSLERPRFFQITLKLVTRKSDNKFLYAQGEHDFADMLLNFLVCPLGGIVRLLGGSSLGSIDALHHSIAYLDICNFVSEKEKDMIVVPRLAYQYFLLSKEILPSRLNNYCCYYQPRKFDIEGIAHNQIFMTNERIYDWGDFCELYPESPKVSYQGYVKGPRIYVATDDLVISPLSPITLLDLLNRFKTSVGDLKEKVVTIGIKECLSILKAALTSTSALSNGLAHLLAEVKEKIRE